MKYYLQKLIDGHDLSMVESEAAMGQILESATDAQVGAFVMGMKMKGETSDEVAGFAKGMLNVANMIRPKVDGILVDTCGTGGDRHNTINISTAAAIVAAAAGVTVAKHGNHSFTSLSGSADVFKELGVKIDLEPDLVKSSIEDIGIGFMLAPKFHPAMKRMVGPRKELAVRTMFNILGPLTNPTGAKAQVIGVFDKDLCNLMAEVLKKLGKEHVMVFHGDGMDEISTLSETFVAELKDGIISNYTLTPEELGVARAKATDIVGGTPEENAHDLLYILNGEKGAKRDIVVVNAAAAIYVAGLAISIKDAIPLAEEAIDSRKALNKLKELVEFTSGNKVDNEAFNTGQSLRNEVC
ncbi:anthranilate phosphoribosyltransferase [Methanococcoides burtonii]|uniref:Anthranilate phosphoribosyltransferase n=1 Tax=Methanococcoides burtonii (strain DSM 6242 / NBRC 107633 / OCM 468 / ACE-M) TaxID=259564 RepID=TRPD_METBU|nr:anthranilate phosphoribosyltransferase [Methanococcoides burtonii]Q12TL1.1 RecName: Full=Anthranilate phosphoribosyltransferase [Methanococcoides burtonii DSM 6242]ABE53215.1 Anthranilate phosphoribosyltransferase [Methanococcoides burtonii DSM 6242]